MKQNDDPGAARSQEAEDVYAEFLRRQREGEEVDVEDFCREHPRLAHALRALHSLETGTRPEDAGQATEFAEALAELPARELDPRNSPLTPGERVGPYDVREVLGEGGFAFVYRAEQLDPVRRTVALKTLKLGLDTREVIARFDAERQALARMNHSHIARIFDAGVTSDGRPYFVMEYVDGEPITAHCDRLTLAIDRRLELFLLVCDAVQHAHQRALIHRDVKPSNVLVTTEDGRSIPKIIDFGIAKATTPDLSERTLFTEAGQIIGTPEYMSPEQAGGFSVDTRTDIYALGVLLYELLCGVRPFEPSKLRQAGFAEIIRVIREETPPRPSTRSSAPPSTPGTSSRKLARMRQATPLQLARRLRGDLDWITMKALAKDPEERYASASEFAADLRRHLCFEPVLAGPPSLRYRLRKFVTKHRRAFVSILCVLLSTLVAGYVVLRIAESRHLEERIRNSVGLLDEGNRLAGEARITREQLLTHETGYEEARATLASWLPTWERDKELEAWRQLQKTRRDLEERYGEAFLHYTNALNLAPSGSAAWKRVLNALNDLYEDIQASGEVSLGTVLLQQQIESTLAGGTRPTAVLGDTTSAVHFTTRPLGSEVYCFRYEELEQRLVPLPYAPRPAAAGGPHLVGQPFLRVERIWDEERAVLAVKGTDSPPATAHFLPGDRFVAVNGRVIRGRRDFARSLAGVGIDRAVAVQLRRDGKVLDFHWIPFRGSWYSEAARNDHLEPGRVISIRDQFGLTFEGYPLDFIDECRVGVTAEDSAVSIELPRGSYLFVFRKEGFVDARYPLRVRGGGNFNEEVHLLQQDKIPPGFVYIPAGVFLHGGSDGDYLQNLEYGETRLGAFFISRLEVTFAEYLEFLNARAEDDGTAEPATSEVKDELLLKLKDRTQAGRAELSSVDLRPFDDVGRRYLVQRVDERWVPIRPEQNNWPVLGISYLAAVEYAYWKSQNEQDGWLYRIPDDMEWEKAARGADGRIFVWGNYMVWTFSFNKNGNHRFHKRPPDFPGMSPLDESVFGVRDLAGSVDELTTGRTKVKRRYVVRRGGAWEGEDEYEFRADSRVGILPESPARRMGIRLVAELESDGARAGRSRSGAAARERRAKSER